MGIWSEFSHSGDYDKGVKTWLAPQKSHLGLQPMVVFCSLNPQKCLKQRCSQGFEEHGSPSFGAAECLLFFHPNTPFQGVYLNNICLNSWSFPGGVKKDPSPVSLMGKKDRQSCEEQVKIPYTDMRWVLIAHSLASRSIGVSKPNPRGWFSHFWGWIACQCSWIHCICLLLSQHCFSAGACSETTELWMKAQTVLCRHFISLVSAGGEGKGNSPAFFPGFAYNLFSGL